jgi:hypothetical protein
MIVYRLRRSMDATLNDDHRVPKTAATPTSVPHNNEPQGQQCVQTQIDSYRNFFSLLLLEL